MRKIMTAGVVAAVLSGLSVPLATLQQQNNIKAKSTCTPDSCINMLTKKGHPFATAASWCAAHNNGC
jgi:hypothetical protein